MGVVALFGYLNRWNDSMGTQLEEPAADTASQRLGEKVGAEGNMNTQTRKIYLAK